MRHRIVSVALILGVAAPGALSLGWAQDGVPATRELVIAPSGVVGTLVGTDGKTPWPERTLVLVDRRTGEPVGTIRTTATGTFSLPTVPVGLYELRVGKVVRAPLQVSRAREALTELTIVAPPGEDEDQAPAGVAPEGGGAAAESGGSLFSSTPFLVGLGGAGIIVAAGAGIGISEFSGSSTGGSSGAFAPGTPVSPSSP